MTKRSTTTQEAISGPILLAQCFGLMPMVGVRTKNSKKLEFRWKSWRSVYTLICTTLFFTNAALYAASLIKVQKVLFGNVVTMLFFSCAFVTSCFFLRLAHVWPKLMNFWKKVDDSMLKTYGFPQGLHRKLTIITVIVMSAAAVEHGFFLSFDIIQLSKSANKDMDVVNVYFKDHFYHIFVFLPYFSIIGATMQAINLFCTFSWNYMDLFVMLMSTALAARFAQVKTRIQKATEEQIKDVDQWMAIREDYNKLSVLTKMLDEALGDIVVLSFANNLFVILVQLLHSLEPSDGRIISRIYFAYSFGFLILRTAAVSLFAARIHAESIEPAFSLICLPGDVYNEEIERLIVQIKIDPSFFSGRGFFKVHKSLILSIAGAIVTYELIFIQFNLQQT